ncbi:hypothetical protein VI01_23740 [Pantoea sp. SM3]|nr:hypothetical protein VI01_23740 [Pantoea sp. SM3]
MKSGQPDNDVCLNHAKIFLRPALSALMQFPDQPINIVCLIRVHITDTATDCAYGFLPEAIFLRGLHS